MPQAPASSSMADSRANIPGHSPGARIQDGVGTSSRTTRWVVRRCGAAYMCLVDVHRPGRAEGLRGLGEGGRRHARPVPRHEVRSAGGGTKHLHHPALGDVVFKHAVLQVADHAEQTLVYFTTTEVPESKLADLAAEIG